MIPKIATIHIVVLLAIATLITIPNLHLLLMEGRAEKPDHWDEIDTDIWRDRP